MKIIHLSDLHLGIDRYGSINPETGLSEQMEDFLQALDDAISYAIDSRASLFLFCGDAYKSRDPSQTQQREFARRVSRLVKNDIAVFLLIGNHDLPHGRGMANSLDIFQTLSVGDVSVASSAGAFRIQTRDGPVQVAAIPWATRSSLLTKDDFRSITIEELNRVIEQKLSDIIRAAAGALDTSLPALLAGHFTHSLATLGSEKGLHLGQDYVVPVGSLNDAAFDYVALGHIHKTQKVEMNVPIVYAGSLQRIDFSEEDQEKGFYSLELDPARGRGQRLLSYEFVPVKTRRFLTIDVKIGAGDTNPTDTVLREIERQQDAIRDSIVRARIYVPGDVQADIAETEIRRALREARHISSISREMEARPRPRLGGMTPEGLDPMTALKEYLKINNIASERQKILLDYALTLQGDALQE